MEFIVPNSAAGMRADHYLADAMPTLSRSRIQSLLREGAILVNAARAKPSDKLRAGDRVIATIPEARPAETLGEDINLDVLHEDSDLIVVNKPPGMVVHPAAGNPTGTLVNALLHHCTDLSGIGGEQRPGIVHRLDKDTSGCIVAAKHDAAHQALAAQFAGREVEKIYLALAAGHFRLECGTIEAPIGRHPVHRKRMAVVATGRPAITGYEVVAAIGEHSLVRCTLHTGRTHQIRVHLQHIGHPLLGDPVYGPKRKTDTFPRQMLHAWRLGFRHPASGERLVLEAPVPPDFRAAGVSTAGKGCDH